jgi:hypothetical protein
MVGRDQAVEPIAGTTRRRLRQARYRRTTESNREKPVSERPAVRLGASRRSGLPNDVKLLGSRTFLQWGVVDPAAKGLGMAFGQALRVDLVK